MGFKVRFDDGAFLKSLLVLQVLLQSASLVSANSSPVFVSNHHSPAERLNGAPAQPEHISLNIGAVLSSPTNIVLFLHQIEVAQMWLPPNAELIAHTVVMSGNPIRTAQHVCDLISRQVYVVIVSHPVQAETSPASVSFTCGFYNIPVIGISNRDSSLSNKNLHGSFMRTIPPYSHQADVWIEILKELQYQSVVFIHSSDNDGRSTLSRFQNMADAAKVKVETIIEYEPGLTNILAELNHTKDELACRVYILYANKEDAEVVFGEVAQLNMTSPGYVWLVSEQALNASNKPDGLLSLVLRHGDDEDAHIKDSVRIAIMALRDLFNNVGGDNVTEPPNNCSNAAGKWETGLRLLQKLKNQTLSDGSTGRIAFDERGDRLDSDYDVVNVVNGRSVGVGHYHYSKESAKMQLSLQVASIVWPGKENNKPLGYFVPTHLKVVTIEEKPFVWVQPPLEDGSCPEDTTPCPKKDHRHKTHMHCCKGYCVDLLKQISAKLNFTYELYQVSDGLYGSYEYSEDGERTWNGLVGELVSKRADMVVAPLAINPERAKVVDFSKPFKFQGIAMIQKRKPRAKKMESFLQPFKNELWLLVFISVFVVAAVLYILDRYSPFGRNMPQDRSVLNEKSLNFSSAIWFSFGVLLNSGIGEKTPMSFSARVLGMVWAGFSMIVVASYTANLAAWLVLDTTETEITGLDDTRLRNPVEGFKYGTVKGSYVDMYFSGQVELSNMYRLMEEYNLHSAEEALAAVKSGDLHVMFWDSPRLEYEAAHDCNLIISGETFARSGYGLGLQKHSFWSERVTLQVLDMHESGLMEALDNKWILKNSEKTCNTRVDEFQNTLGLETMSDVFLLVGAGMVAGIGLIILEVCYKKRRNKRLKRTALAKKAVAKWRWNIQQRRLLRTERLPLPPMGPSSFANHHSRQQHPPGRTVSPFNPTLECHPDFGKKLRANEIMPVYTIDNGPLNEYHHLGADSFAAGNFTEGSSATLPPMHAYPAQYRRQGQQPFISRDQAHRFGGSGSTNATYATLQARHPQIDPDAIPPPPPPPSVSPRMRPCLYTRTPRGTKRCNQIA